MGVNFEVIATDNASATMDTIARKMATLTNQTKQMAKDNATILQSVNANLMVEKKAQEEHKKTQLNAIGALTAINTMASGLRLVSVSIMSLGLFSDETNEKIAKLIATFQLMAGVASLIKGVTLASEAMGIAETKVAVVETYRSILANPWMMAVVGAGIGTAVGVGAYMGLSGNSNSSSSNTNYNIYYGSGSSQIDNTNTVKNVIKGDRI